MDKVELILAEIEKRIKEAENTAEEYFQEIDDSFRGNEILEGVTVLRELKDFILKL